MSSGIRRALVVAATVIGTGLLILPAAAPSVAAPDPSASSATVEDATDDVRVQRSVLREQVPATARRAVRRAARSIDVTRVIHQSVGDRLSLVYSLARAVDGVRRPGGIRVRQRVVTRLGAAKVVVRGGTVRVPGCETSAGSLSGSTISVALPASCVPEGELTIRTKVSLDVRQGGGWHQAAADRVDAVALTVRSE